MKEVVLKTFTMIMVLFLLGMNDEFLFQMGGPKISAWTDVKWNNGKPCVMVEQEWFELISFNKVPVSHIVDFVKKNTKRPEKRFAEDMIMVMILMKKTIGRDVELELRNTGGEKETKKIRMTKDNRRQLLRNRNKSIQSLTAAQMIEDLNFFEEHLRKQFAYLEANDVNLEKVLVKTRQRINQGFSLGQFGLEIRKLLALFIDGHARVSGVPNNSSKYLPFLVEKIKDDYVAFKPDRSGFLKKGYPYVAKINNKPMESWINELKGVVSKGSKQYVVRNVLREMRDIQAYSTEKKRVRVRLLSKDKKRSIEVSSPLSNKFPTYGSWPDHLKKAKSHVLKQNIGYLPIQRMDDRAAARIKEWMPRFKDTIGLIVDVRGNGGGTRTPLLAIFPFLMNGNDKPQVVSAAKYRLCDRFPENHLDYRFMLRANDPRLKESERLAIDAFSATFKPEWSPPKDKFSPWHYLVLSKGREYFYNKPVVVLMDEKCFSATDIFLSALKGWRNVTLMGAPSGGGSAFSQSFSLPHSRLKIRCASMASFQTSGQLYDTHGVWPDVQVDPPPEYYLRKGEDVFLNGAVKRIIESQQRGR